MEKSKIDSKPVEPLKPKITPINKSKLVHISNFTDEEGGVILMFAPILPNGNLDPLRQPYFKGQIPINNQVMTFNIPKAQCLEDCYDLWESSVQAFIADLQSQMIKNQLLHSRSRQQ